MIPRGNGGDEGTRTPDPRDANAVLFQLSYIPTRGRSLAQPSRSKPGMELRMTWARHELSVKSDLDWVRQLGSYLPDRPPIRPGATRAGRWPDRGSKERSRYRKALTSRTDVLLSESNDDAFPQRSSRSGDPSGSLGRGSSALGRNGPICTSRGHGGASGGAAAGRGGAGLTEYLAGRVGSGCLHRLPGPGCDSRTGRVSSCCSHCPSRRRNQRQNDAGAAGRGASPGGRWNRGVSGSCQEP